MKAYTDYPINQLGDEPYKEAPIREIEVLSYDRNKYCYIKVCGIVDSIKAGYIYKELGRCGHVASVSLESLKKLPSSIEE